MFGEYGSTTRSRTWTIKRHDTIGPHSWLAGPSVTEPVRVIELSAYEREVESGNLARRMVAESHNEIERLRKMLDAR